ncbi:MAG: radical SAM protein, partial [Microgenomates group bacterium]
MKKYFLKIFGCQMNVSDSERIAAWYEQRGWGKAEKMEDADEVVIVTCSVRQTAEDRVYGLVNNLAKCKVAGKPKIILTGCMLRYPLRWLKEKLPAVDEFKKIDEYQTRDIKYQIHGTQKQALVKIMEGCNNFCSYCVVPYARGREISRPFEEIVCEVQELANRGVKEIILLGQNVNSYGKDLNNSKFKIQNAKSQFKIKNFRTLFATLLATLHEIPGIEKISFLTSNPWDLNDEIIEAMALPKIDRYLHLPVQSGDDEILKKMNRKYTVADYLKLVEKI